MNLYEQDFVPVILGADITAYSLVRSFHEKYNVKSLVVSQARCGYIANSDILENRVFAGLEKKEVLVERLIEIGKEFEGKTKLIVMGCGDWYVRALIESKKELEPYFIVPYIDEELLNRIVKKDKFYEICDELNINHPRTYVYNCGEENSLDFDFRYPIIAKTADSAMYHYAKFEGKKKVFLLDSLEELKTVLKNLEGSSYNYKFLIQEYIEGDDDHMRVLTCYSDKNGKVRFASFGQTLLEDHTPTALGNPVAIINDVNEEVVKQATRFLEHIGYVGYSNFDLKYNDKDGTYNFFEINVRLGRSNFYVTGSGFNALMWIVDEEIYGKTHEYTIADKEHLFTVVPKGVILKYVKNKELKKKVKRLYREKKVSYPLFYKADKNLKHKFYAFAALMNQYRKFAKHFPKN